ncbi:MAG: hypothetical protein IJY47_05020 [Clostridia bacterium]|nr:hypothetical protein [Clostridia bacterium]
MNHLLPSSVSLRLLYYGSFAILCQITLIFLLIVSTDPSVSPQVICHEYAPYLEYVLMDLALLLGGALLIDYVILRDT